VVALLLSSAPATAVTAEFTVLSYNTHGLHRWIARDEPARRFPLIGERARAYDVVLLQEVFLTEYFDLLGFGADSGWQAHRGNGPRPGPLGLMSLCDGCGSGLVAALRPGVAVVATEREAFGLCAGKIRGGHDCWATKGLLFLRLRLPDGSEVDVYDLHLDSGDRGADFRARRAQIGQVREAIESRSAGRAAIVAGDFNMKQGVRRDREMLEEFCGHLGLLDSGARAAGDRWPEVIDFILYRPGPAGELTLIESGEAVEFVDAAQRPLSDHPALLARFRTRRSK
jgi:endonuclease/exonuclease/phosphatase family metal-dependent hydrolase